MRKMRKIVRQKNKERATKGAQTTKETRQERFKKSAEGSSLRIIINNP